MKMKKIISSLVLSVAMSLTCVVGISASDIEKNVKLEELDERLEVFRADKDMKEFSMIVEEYLKLVNQSDEVSSKKENNFSMSNMITRSSRGYSQKQAQTMLESAMSLYEGVSASQLAKATAAALVARDEAEEYARSMGYYTGGVLITWDNEADALRHFRWNEITASQIGRSKTKIITDNHEIAHVEAEKLYYSGELKYMSSLGISRHASEVVDLTKKGLKQSKSKYLSYFKGSSTYMDFYNNEKGRSYGAINGNDFRRARPYLILKPSEVTYSIKTDTYYTFRGTN